MAAARLSGGDMVGTLPSVSDIWAWLDEVPDPEIPVISVVDLGIVRGVAYGLIAQSDALKRYQISEDEFHEWVKAVAAHGEEALKATAVQKFRNS